MSVNIGSKPIVTSGLTHLYDQLSPVSMPYGSDVWYNHLPTSYVVKNAKNSKNMTKNGLAAYGSKTAHAHLKGYDTYDGSSDYWAFAENVHEDLPLITYPATIIIWSRHSGANTTTRALGGWGGSSSSGYYASYGSVYYTSSKLKPQWTEYGTSSSARTMTMDVDLDTNWHMWTYRAIGSTSRNFTLDAGDFGALVSNTSSANRPFNTNTVHFHIGTRRRSTSYDSSWIGDIGPWYIWNRELSDSEVRQMYNANKDRFNF